MARISIACLKVINGDNEEAAVNNMAAFLILPGLMAEMRVRKDRAVVSFLKQVGEHGEPARCILNEARRLRGLRSTESRAWRKPTFQDLNKKLEARIFEGRVGAAKQLLDSMQVLEDGAVYSPPMGLAAVREKIKALNPAARLDPALPLHRTDFFPVVGVHGDPVGLVLEAKEVLMGIRRLPKDTCTGSSGWSNRAIMSLILAEEEVEQLVAELTILFNRSLSGAVATGVVALWSTGRAALIPKPDGSWRPLGMGECWYRLMGRVIVQSYSEEVGQKLAPLQLCVGVTAGCEIAARMAQMVMSIPEEAGERMCLVQLDVSNAFNEIPRGKVATAVKQYAPKLMRWFRSFYGMETGLRTASGELVGTSATGVRQGDPMAMLLYAVGFQSVLVNIERCIQRHKESTGSRLPVGTFGYADDTSVYMGTAVATAATGEILQLVVDSGLRVNVKKGTVLVHEADRHNVNSYGMPIETEGVKVLGNPVGSDAHIVKYCEKSLKGMLSSRPMLRRIHPQSALMILKQVLNTQPVYLARVVDYRLIDGLLREFDDGIDEALLVDIAGGQATLEGRQLRTLPQSMGGLGIARYSGAQGIKSNGKSINLTCAFVSKNVPALEDIVLGHVDHIAQLGTMPEEAADVELQGLPCRGSHSQRSG
jgi:hypothetical protein